MIAHLGEKTWPFVKGHIVEVGRPLTGQRPDGGGMEQVSDLALCEVLENGLVCFLVYVDAAGFTEVGFHGN